MRASTYREIQGMTLIEVLVTMLIVSIGLMGLASLQATSIKESVDTSKRSQGLWMIDELAARMRANVDGQGSGYTSVPANICTGGPQKKCSDHYSGNAAANCTGDEMAEFDVWEVICGHDNGEEIISGSNDNINITNHSITCVDSDAGDGIPCSPQSNFTITLQWTAKAVNDATANSENYAEDSTQSITLTIRP